ncbi:hypothetical protein K3495_g4214 [Podosphaera aphanis]|nr:hypothetical protein K3495_g4214 [Podosphaera aphanis]
MAKQPSGSKLLPKAEKCVFVGYTKVDHHYRIFVPDKIKLIISADVTFPVVKTKSKITIFSSDMNNHKQLTTTHVTRTILIGNGLEHQIQNSLPRDPSHTFQSISQQSTSTSPEISTDTNTTYNFSSASNGSAPFSEFYVHTI